MSVLMGDALSAVWTGSPVPGAHRQILTRRQMKQGGRRVVPDKRTISVAGGLLVAAALAMAACAPSGYNTGNSASNNNAAPALANATGTPDASASATADASAGTSSNSGTTANVSFTTQLNATSVPKMGNVVENQDGFVLYRFDKDTANPPKSNCSGKCAVIWPPQLTDGTTALSGVSADVVGTVTRADGTRQLTIHGWPVYHYIGDLKAGTWKGQGVGHTWWVIDKNGKKNLTCVPTGTPTAVAPPADTSSNSNSSSTTGSSSTGSTSTGSSGGYGY
jgi:predicted lipoprotein with Yx(FWY)xxD motif